MRAHEVQSARKAFGMSQTEFGEWLGLKSCEPRRTIHNLESGRTPVSGPIAKAITLELENRGLRDMLRILQS